MIEIFTATLKMMKDFIWNDLGVKVCISTVRNALGRLKITLKTIHRQVDKINDSETLRKRKEYAIDFLKNAPKTKKKIIFFDESGFNLHLRRSRGRAKKGKIAKATVPTSQGRNVTLIVAMNNKEIIHYKVIDWSTCNSKIVQSFVSELLNHLDEDEDFKGSWIIMDNVRTHKSILLRNIIEKRGYHQKFLSPYSPMLNPAESVFSKIKTIVRQQLSQSPTSLEDVIKHAVNEVNERDCRNYCKHMESNLQLAKDEKIIDK